MCHSLFVNSQQLAPCVAVFGISTEEEEVPFSSLPGGDLHSSEIQGLAELADHVHNGAGENGKCCMASAGSCYTHSTDNCKKERKRLREHNSDWSTRDSTVGGESHSLKRHYTYCFALSKNSSDVPSAQLFCMLAVKKAILMNTFDNSSLPAFEKRSVKNTDFILTQLSIDACHTTGLSFSKGYVLTSLHLLAGKRPCLRDPVWSASQCRGTHTGTAAVTGTTTSFDLPVRKAILTKISKKILRITEDKDTG